MSTRKPQPHRFGAFDVRGVRVVGGWCLPVNSDSQVKWKDRTEGDGEPQRRPYPEMRRQQRKR